MIQPARPIDAPRLFPNARPGIVRQNRMSVGLLLLALSLFPGCRIDNIESARRAASIASIGSTPLVKVKKLERSKSFTPLKRLISGRPEPSMRTELFLRKHSLLESYQSDPASVVATLQKSCRSQPDMASVHAIAELARLEADWAFETREKNESAVLYAQAVIHAYQFLFDSSLDVQRNAYDPQFREICDIYNHSLENLLRIVCDSSSFQAGSHHHLGDPQAGIEFDVVVEGRWKEEEFARFELANDYQVSGIENQYQTFGLGVPLIAIRKSDAAGLSPFEKYYPPSLALPMTAFCEVAPADERSTAAFHATLRLFDPLEKTVVRTDTRAAPLESDLTVPLAWYLNDPLLNTDVFSTISLLNADVASDYFGFYMLEPFDPEKIPVVMVHGLWSTPVTWMKMFNDLRADPRLRDKYQFWFYMYPTGQPFWISSANMRRDLATLRRDVNPDGRSTGMREMIFVGHSMGGLLSRMLTVDSGNEFWRIISDQPISEIRGSDLTKQQIRNLFFFTADPDVSRVITIASPHRGSSYANNATRWLSHQIFKLPKLLTDSFDEFVEDNRSILRNTRHLTIPTSVDSLSPQSPFIAALLAAKPEPSVRFHNIYGNVENASLLDFGTTTPGDGVVSVESAALPGALSELAVDAEHMEVHQHPEAILEVKRILLLQGNGEGKASRIAASPADPQR